MQCMINWFKLCLHIEFQIPYFVFSPYTHLRQKPHPRKFPKKNKQNEKTIFCIFCFYFFKMPSFNLNAIEIQSVSFQLVNIEHGLNRKFDLKTFWVLLYLNEFVAQRSFQISIKTTSPFMLHLIVFILGLFFFSHCRQK